MTAAIEGERASAVRPISMASPNAERFGRRRDEEGSRPPHEQARTV